MRERIDRIQHEARLLRDRLDRAERRVAELERADIVVETRKLKLRAPDGTFFALVVDNGGALATSDEGSGL